MHLYLFVSFSAATLQPPVPFLAQVPWDYQETPELMSALREGLLLRYAACPIPSSIAGSPSTITATDKRQHPVFTVYGGPGAGKSRLLSELPRLAVAAAEDNAALKRILQPAFVFHVGFENGTKYQISESNGSVAVGNRMMWQLMRPPAENHGFAAFSATHAYTVDAALDMLSVLTQCPRTQQSVFLLVDGVHNLRVPEADAGAFRGAVDAISSVVCSGQFVVGAVSATAGIDLENMFGSSQQRFVGLSRLACFCGPPRCLIPNASSLMTHRSHFLACFVMTWVGMGEHWTFLRLL
jgi:hypothetical protein